MTTNVKTVKRVFVTLKLATRTASFIEIATALVYGVPASAAFAADVAAGRLERSTTRPLSILASALRCR
jgi:hypothetical protein